MDFERATLMALFYDYPIGMVMYRQGYAADVKTHLHCVPKVMRWEVPEYSLAECKRWIEGLVNRYRLEVRDNGYLLSFRLIADYARQMLDVQSLQVKDKQLLRWHSMALPMSEDLLTCAALAYEEKDDATGRTDFLWTNVLPYGNTEAQRLTSKALCDVHAHIDASADTFDIGWIDRMNHFNIKRGGNINILETDGIDLDTSQELTPLLWKDVYPKGWAYMDWISLAAYLRHYIYQLVEHHRFPSRDDYEEMTLVVGDTEMTLSALRELYRNRSVASQQAMSTNCDRHWHWDYAIPEDAAGVQSPYAMFWGERRLLYGCLRMLYRDAANVEVRRFAKVFYLYILVKLRARKELIQTNALKGLSNYQVYQKNNMAFRPDGTEDMHVLYAMQSAMGEKGKNLFEARIGINKVGKVENLRLDRQLLGKEAGKLTLRERNLTLVATISKSGAGEVENREYTQFKEAMLEQIDQLLRMDGKPYPVCGIDFAGSDTKLRPEVFAQVVRYARINGIKHFTYHAGEDFFDLLDGIRTISEVLYHLRWNHQCRLGHILALCVNAQAYYQKRHRKSLVPKQVLLDNLVWLQEMCRQLQLSVPAGMAGKIASLFGEIYQGLNFDHSRYVSSMKLRGDNVTVGRLHGASGKASSSLMPGGAAANMRRNADVKELFRLYTSDREVFKTGQEVVEWHVTDEVIRVIPVIQDYLLKEIVRKGIGVESCPTSNLTIGNFARYEELPPLRLSQVTAGRNRLKVSLNTDDKGILATSIENEYALMYAAYRKAGRSEADVTCLLEQMRTDSIAMRFGGNICRKQRIITRKY